MNTRSLPGYEPNVPANSGQIVPREPGRAEDQEQPLGGIRPFDPDRFEALLNSGPPLGGQTVLPPMGGIPQPMSWLPRFPEPPPVSGNAAQPRAIEGPSNPIDMPIPGGDDVTWEARQELLVVGPSPGAPHDFPNPSSFIEASQQMITRWIARTTTQRQQSDRSHHRYREEVSELQEREARLHQEYQAQIDATARALRQQLSEFYENRWKLVRQRAWEEFMQLEQQAHNTQQEEQTELTNKLRTAEQMLQQHQTEMVETFQRRIQGVKEEVREYHVGESRLRSELQHHLARSEKLASTETAKLTAEKQRAEWQKKHTQAEPLVKELSARERQLHEAHAQKEKCLKAAEESERKVRGAYQEVKKSWEAGAERLKRSELNNRSLEAELASLRSSSRSEAETQTGEEQEGMLQRESDLLREKLEASKDLCREGHRRRP